jgi:hypothetical protein
MPRIRAQIGRITVRNPDDSSLNSKVISALDVTSRGKLTLKGLANDSGFPLSALRGGGFDSAAKVGRQPDGDSKFFGNALHYVRHFSIKVGHPTVASSRSYPVLASLPYFNETCASFTPIHGVR